MIEAAGRGYDAVYAGTSYTLTAGQEIELLSAIDPGSTGAMNLTGNAAANEIYGNAGANVIDGKAGDDLLFGRGGADTFAFSVSPDMGNVDTLADFLAGTDKIGVDDSVFNGVGTPGAFNANASGSAPRPPMPTTASSTTRPPAALLRCRRQRRGRRLPVRLLTARQRSPRATSR